MKYIKIIMLSLLLTASVHSLAQEQPLRRIISEEQPAWIIHIDVWNYADPQKIIDMVPEDVRPFVIFNIATSTTDEKSANGPAIYDSWMKVCAQNRVWTMIQCASGAYNRMPDTPDDVSAYEQYFKDYPNFLGFNFAEQYWGFDTKGSVTFDNRLQLFAQLLPICKDYGGYLAVSFADTYHNANKMPVAYVKRNDAIRSFLSQNPEHFLCFEKYTQKKNFLDIESQCLGAWLSGIAGNYGIRFDSSGWVEKDTKPDMQDGDTQYTVGASEFVRAAGAIPIAEHMMLTGQTIMDGPELIWAECSVEGKASTADGFSRRNWQWVDQWKNITLDLFRKILDGTIRIMNKQEVMERTKVCVVSSGSGSNNSTYRTPAALFDGVYRNEKDYGGLQGRDANHWLNNRWWMKSTGRYPTIPTMLEPGSLTDIGKWVSSTEEKQAQLNALFPEEYVGDIYAGRHENGWVTYNPYQYDDITSANGIRTLSAATKRASGNISLQYNTCTGVQLDYAPYSLGILKEYADQLTLYLNNYQTTGLLSEDIIKIHGASRQPTCNWIDRSTKKDAIVTSTWKDGVMTIKVIHNGPVDLTINCKGTATDRKTAYTSATIRKPAAPEVYSGALQYEAELADYQKATIRKSGFKQGKDGYQGQGFTEMATDQSKLRFNINVPRADYYELALCYQTDSDGNLMIGNESVRLLKNTNWTTASIIVQLKSGQNELIVQNTGNTNVAVDYIRLQTFEALPFITDSNGEFHVPLSSLMTTGALTFDHKTGIVTQGSNKVGTMCVFLSHADFSEVTSLRMSYEGDGSLFRYLVISDNAGNSINPNGNMGGFWSSKYNLNYTDYQVADASRSICKLEWVADAPLVQARTMTIKDILIKTSKSTNAIRPAAHKQPMCFFNLHGQKAKTPSRGVQIVRTKDGRTIKRIY